MTAAKRVRWECARGVHPAVLASTRPALDSIDRYCLPCSYITGKLEKRIAPALERKRTNAADSQAAKAKRKRASEAAKRKRAKDAENAKHFVDGVDLRVEYKRLLRLRAFGGKNGRPYKRPPTLEIRPRTSKPRAQLGCLDYWRNHIIVNTYPGQDIHDARETLVHELTHAALSADHNHDAAFNLMLAKAMREAYGVIAKGVRENVYHGRYAAALRAKAAGE